MTGFRSGFVAGDPSYRGAQAVLAECGTAPQEFVQGSSSSRGT
jgi:hypothetical protein